MGKVTSLNAPTHLELFLQRSECQTEAEECLRAYFMDRKRLKSAQSGHFRVLEFGETMRCLIYCSFAGILSICAASIVSSLGFFLY